MGKQELTPQCLIPVRPIFIVGSNVASQANFLEVGGGGLVSSNPPMVAIPLQHDRYTLKGIMENRTFSLSIPSVELAREADYCGIVSGAKRDKVKDCNFSIFYGKLGTAPMIEQCPINMECAVVHILGSNSHLIVIGRIEGTYISQELTAEEKPNWNRISPLLWFREKGEYVAIGHTIGKSRSMGNEIEIAP